ncbi:MAG: response regulator [Methanocorpusculum sp.]|nr:response regulator [Methanocorpusculum sp.]
MGKNRILIVEDDLDISEIITLNLQYSEYEYVALDDGMKTIEYLRKDHAFDLAILDIMLPGIDGFALMEYMRRYNIPVLYLTAKADVGSKIKGLRDGAEDYMVKPFEVLELLVRIETSLDKGIQPLIVCDG